MFGILSPQVRMGANPWLLDIPFQKNLRSGISRIELFGCNGRRVDLPFSCLIQPGIFYFRAFRAVLWLCQLYLSDILLVSLFLPPPLSPHTCLLFMKVNLRYYLKCHGRTFMY